MDIDCLTEAEQKEYMQKGKCFNCGKTRHHANDPEFHSKNKGKTVHCQEIEEEDDGSNDRDEELHRLTQDF
jgi:hypothetical protein